MERREFPGWPEEVETEVLFISQEESDLENWVMQRDLLLAFYENPGDEPEHKLTLRQQFKLITEIFKLNRMIESLDPLNAKQ